MVSLAAGVVAVVILGACSSSKALDARLTGPGPVGQGGTIPIGGPDVGTPLPTATYERLDGGAASFSDYRGKPLVVNVWASWCSPCKQEMPAFEQVHQAMKDRFGFVGLNSRDDRNEARSVARSTGVTYDLLYDPKAGFVADTGVVAFPSTLFVDPGGKVVAVHAGALKADELRAKLQELFGP